MTLFLNLIADSFIQICVFFLLENLEYFHYFLFFLEILASSPRFNANHHRMYWSLRPQAGLDKYHHSPEAVLNKLQRAEAPLPDKNPSNATQYVWHKEYRNHLNKSKEWLDWIVQPSISLLLDSLIFIHLMRVGRPLEDQALFFGRLASPLNWLAGFFLAMRTPNITKQYHIYL